MITCDLSSVGAKVDSGAWMVIKSVDLAGICIFLQVYHVCVCLSVFSSGMSSRDLLDAVFLFKNKRWIAEPVSAHSPERLKSAIFGGFCILAYTLKIYYRNCYLLQHQLMLESPTFDLWLRARSSNCETDALISFCPAEPACNHLCVNR